MKWEQQSVCGIMFPIRCNDNLPIQHVDISTVSVYGQLGLMTVWVFNDIVTTGIKVTWNSCKWTKLHDETHAPSQHELVPLQLDAPIQLLPGQTRLIYIHSSSPGNEAIVCSSRSWNGGSYLSLPRGSVHAANTAAFGTTIVWSWKEAQKSHQSFFGQIDYDAVHLLWSPTTRHHFGPNFHAMINALLSCQQQFTNPISILPNDILYYILSMCPWDWVNDKIPSMQQYQQTQSYVDLTQPGEYNEGYESDYRYMNEDSDESYELYDMDEMDYRYNRYSR